MAEENTNTIKVKKNVAIEMFDSYSVGDVVEDFMFIQELPTDDQGKYQHESKIYLHVPSKKFYRLNFSRSGSYFSEYYWEWEDLKEEDEVELVQVRMVPVEAFIWKAVK